jgi:hypothetical protein
MTIEERLTAAFRAADQYQPSPDLFEKVTKSIDEDAAHRRRVRRIVLSAVAALGFVAAYLVFAIDRVEGVIEMPFWSLELLVTAVMTVLVLVLGPAIRRFGTAFEGEIFRSSPETGASFLTLMDVAYYTIFGAYILLTLQYSTAADVQGVHLVEWLEFEAWRIGGLFMLMGVLHAATLAVLPAVGLVFSANMRSARRAELGRAAPVTNPRNDQVDRWITIVVWILVGLGLLQLAVIVLPLIIGLGG